MAGASTTFLPKSKRSPRRSPRVRAKPGAVRSGSPGACVRVKAPDESVIPASVFWGGANGDKSSKETKASSSISSDTKSPGAVSAVALANDSAAVPLATVDLWKASSVLTDSAVSTAQRTMTTPPPPAGREGEAGVSLQPSEREDIAEPAEVQASTELATASTLLAPGTGSPSWTPSRQTWSPRVMQPVSPFLSHRAGSMWTMPSRQTWSASLMTSNSDSTPLSNPPEQKVGSGSNSPFCMAPVAPSGPSAGMVASPGIAAAARTLASWQPQRVEPPMAQVAHGTSPSLRDDVRGTGYASVPSPMLRECPQPPASPYVLHAQRHARGVVEQPASRPSPRVSTKPGSSLTTHLKAEVQSVQATQPSKATTRIMPPVASTRPFPPDKVGTGSSTPSAAIAPSPKASPGIAAAARTLASWQPPNCVEPPLVQGIASPRYFGRDESLPMALGTGYASVPAPMLREGAPRPLPAGSPPMRHARSLGGDTFSLTPRRRDGVAQKLSQVPSLIPWAHAGFCSTAGARVTLFVVGFKEPASQEPRWINSTIHCDVGSCQGEPAVPMGPAREPVPHKLSTILNADISPRYHTSGQAQVRKQKLAAGRYTLDDNKDGYWEVAEGKQEFIYTV